MVFLWRAGREANYFSKRRARADGRLLTSAISRSSEGAQDSFSPPLMLFTRKGAVPAVSEQSSWSYNALPAKVRRSLTPVKSASGRSASIFNLTYYLRCRDILLQMSENRRILSEGLGPAGR
jgi:hypothetical protein